MNMTGGPVNGSGVVGVADVETLADGLVAETLTDGLTDGDFEYDLDGLGDVLTDALTDGHGLG